METAYAMSRATSLRAGEDRWVEVLGVQFRGFLEQVRARLAPASANDVDDLLTVKELEPYLGPPFHRFIRHLNDVTWRIPAERVPAVRRRLKEQLEELLMPAPIFRQSLRKPLGYAGDYLTMSIAYGDHYQGETAYAKYLNRMFCDLSVSRAAISRVDYLRRWIDWAVHDSAGPSTRILSVACGPAREVRDHLASAAVGKELVVSLLDQDPRALAFAQAELAPLTGRGRRVRVAPVNAAVKHLVRDPARFAGLAGQHLIYAAGLFDSLPDHAATSLLRALFALLAPGGSVVVGNLSPRCDSRGFLENLVDWHMIYRTDDELLGLAYGLPAAATIEREATGVNGFLVLRRGNGEQSR